MKSWAMDAARAVPGGAAVALVYLRDRLLRRLIERYGLTTA
jgi:hypothetical protein